jgi:hypothetical protein
MPVSSPIYFAERKRPKAPLTQHTASTSDCRPMATVATRGMECLLWGTGGRG